nr:hypothetical protein [Tanacetum cinerariifolium]
MPPSYSNKLEIIPTGLKGLMVKNTLTNQMHPRGVTNVVKGISEHYVLMPNILPTLPTFDPLYPVYDTLLLFSSENGDKVFKPGILSYLLVSHRDKATSDFSENLMMMYGGDIPSKVVSNLHTIPMEK